jgi:DnaJ-class molecular chaperone
MDLIMKMDISLRESLCGFKKTIETLDDRTLVIQTIPGTLTTFYAMLDMFYLFILGHRY